MRLQEMSHPAELIMTQFQSVGQNAAASRFSRVLAFLYGFAAYAAFVVTILYAIGFVTGLPVPKDIDTGQQTSLPEALVVDIALMSLFAVQHSVMARKPFKAWWTQFVPKSIERSTYVLLASLCLMLLFWQWRPLPAEALVRMIADAEQLAFNFSAVLAEENVAAAAAGIGVPTLLMSGGLSPYVAQRTVARPAGLIAGSHAKHFADAGHMLPKTHRDLVNAEIIRHITRADARVAFGPRACERRRLALAGINRS
jgi:pimeloyl-ACP methyl ester carboxylesterase